MRFIYQTVSALLILLYPTISYTSGVRFDTDMPSKSPSSLQQERSPRSARVQKLLDLKGFSSSQDLSSEATPRTPDTDCFEEYCVHLHYVREIRGEKKTTTLNLTPSTKPFSKKESPDPENFLSFVEENFGEAFPPFESSGSIIVFKTFENRNLLTITFYTTQIKKSLSGLLETKGAFAKALHAQTSLRDEVRGSDYLMSETARLKKDWLPFAESVKAILLFLDNNKEPPLKEVLQLSGRYQDYLRRYDRYQSNFCNEKKKG